MEITQLFAAVDEIVEGKMRSLHYDITVRATIIDASNAEQGEYTVDDGSHVFTAYSENTKYKVNTVVYITIPNGDYNQQKLIAGKFLTTEQEYYNYTKPSDLYVDVTGNLFNDIDEHGLIANGEEQEIVLASISPVSYKKYNRLLIRGSFKTWLKTFDLIDGNYGLRLDVIESDSVTVSQEINRYIPFYLDSSEMVGNIYNFEVPYEQEALFDISDIHTITTIRLVAYQKANFSNSVGNIESMQTPNIFITKPYISLGYSTSGFNEDMALLYTENSLTFSEYLNDSMRESLGLDKDEVFSPERCQGYIDICNTKNIKLRWIKINDDKTNNVMGKLKVVAITKEEDLPENAAIHWYRYVSRNDVIDELAGVFWEEMHEYKNKFEIKEFIPNSKVKYEKIKVIVENPSTEYLESVAQEEYLKYQDDITLTPEERAEKLTWIRALSKADQKSITSEVLTFTNEVDVPDYAAIDLISGLTIDVDSSGLNGIYRIYNETGNISSEAEAYKNRVLTANYYTTVSGTDSDTAEQITWIFPINNTMIEQPKKGIEYDDYDIVTEYPDRIEITRYGVAPTSAAGQVELDSTQQYFRIKSYLSQNFTNNTIICRITKNNRIYESSATLTFGTHGIQGTDFTFMLKFVNQEPAVLAKNGYRFQVEPVIYDSDNNDITDSMEGKTISYSWYSQNTKDKNATNKIAFLSDAEKTSFKPRFEVKTDDIRECSHYILQCNLYGVYVLTAGQEQKKSLTLTAYLPIAVRNTECPKATINGASIVKYNTNGASAEYYQNPYQLFSNQMLYQSEDVNEPKTELVFFDKKTIIKGENGKEDTIQYPPLRWRFNFGDDSSDALTEVGQNFYPALSEENTLIIPTPYISNIGKQISVEAVYNGKYSYWDIEKTDNEVNIPTRVKVEKDFSKNEIVLWSQPLYIYQDAYGSPMLNAWDGKLTIDQENGTILSTMIGVGTKDSNNTFNGLLMGNVSKGTGDYSDGIGLYGYNKGIQNFGLKVDGTAFFGKKGKGQIILNGTQGTITSGIYNQTKTSGSKRGMIIDLDGTNGNGSLIEMYGDYGHIKMDTSKQKSTLLEIEGREKTSDGYTTLMKVSSSDYYLQTLDFNGSNSGTKIDLKSGNITSYNFNINASGGGGNISINSGASTYPLDINGKFLVDWSGNVTLSGNLTATGNITSTTGTLTVQKLIANQDGEIGGWTITSSTLENKNKTTILDSTGTITCNKLIAKTDGDIGGWTIGSSGLTNGFFTLGGGSNGIGLKDGSNAFQISSKGVTIGGWSITQDCISNGSTKLYSGGRIILESGSHKFTIGDGTKHPYASGLNVGNSGIVCEGGISALSIGAPKGEDYFVGTGNWKINGNLIVPSIQVGDYSGAGNGKDDITFVSGVGWKTHTVDAAGAGFEKFTCSEINVYNKRTLFFHGGIFTGISAEKSALT